MISLRTLAAAAACTLFLAACSATIAPPYGDDRPTPPPRSQTSKSSKSRSSKAKKPSATSKKKGASSQAPWEGSCEPQGTCDRVDRTCEAEGTLCVFADAGPIGSCLTIDQRKNCPLNEEAPQ